MSGRIEIEKIIKDLDTVKEEGFKYTFLDKINIFRGDPTKFAEEAVSSVFSTPEPPKMIPIENYTKDIILGSEKAMNSHRYFGFTEGNVFKYGKDTFGLKSIIHEFKVIEPIKLLNMDDEETKLNLIEDFKNDNKEDIVKIIENNFGGKKNIRNSKDELDGLLVDALCEKGFMGYIIGVNTKTTDEFEGYFHPEIALCRTSFGKLEYVKTHERDANTPVNNEDEMDQSDDDYTPGPARKLFGGIKKTYKKRKNSKSKKSRKVVKGGNDNKKESLLDYLKTGMGVEEIAENLVKNNYKGLFENREGTIENPKKFQIKFKIEEGDEFPNVNICFVRYVRDSEDNIYGIVAHYADKQTGKCPERGYESYFYFDEELAYQRDKYFLMDIEFQGILDRKRELGKAMVKELPTINKDTEAKISDFLGGKKQKKMKTKKTKKRTHKTARKTKKNAKN